VISLDYVRKPWRSCLVHVRLTRVHTWTLLISLRAHRNSVRCWITYWA